MRVFWDKSERGGKGSRRRSTVPEALPIADEHLTDCANTMIVEELHWSAAHNFSRPAKVIHRRLPLPGQLFLGGATIDVEPERLVASFQWSAEHVGAPERAFPWQLELVITPKEWVRLQHNGRFTYLDTGGWWYQQVTLNIALFSSLPVRDIFIRSEPTRVFRSMVHLL